MKQIIKEIKEALNASDKKTKAYDTQAEIVRVEGGTAWVHIPGGVDETPVKLTMDAKQGDIVQMRVSGGRAWLTGNKTAPPTDDATANQARSIANGALDSAEIAAEAAGRAVNSAYQAEQSAAAAQSSATNAYNAAVSAQSSADSALVSLATVEDVVGVLNWITAHGTMTANGSAALDPSKVYFIRDAAGDYEVGSYHYSIVSEPKAADRTSYYTLSVDESVQNYVATHVAVNTEGLWLIPDQFGTPSTNGKKILIATGAGSAYTTAGTYIIDKVNGLDHVIASFRANGVTIGENNTGMSRVDVSSTGMAVTKNDGGNDVQIAELGYGQGVNTDSGTSTAPRFTFGRRKSGEAIGIYSFAQGIDGVVASNACSSAMGYTTGSGQIEASGLGSHAEGFASSTYKIEASGTGSHAEGVGQYGDMLSSGTGSHCEGSWTSASNFASHAEGSNTSSSGTGSHSEGIRTIASSSGSHAEGSDSESSGQYSHAQNFGTVADQSCQTAIGKFNKRNNTGNLFVIGNGTGDNTRSDVFEVDENGKVKVQGHSSAIGTVKEAFASAKNVSSAKDTNLTSISLEAGTWVITGGVRFPNNGTGFRRMNIATTNGSNAADVQLPALSGASTQLAYTVIVTPNTTTSYYLNCYQNSGSTLSLIAGGGENGVNFLRAVRIA